MPWWDDTAYQAYLTSQIPTPVTHPAISQSDFLATYPMINSSSRAWNPSDPTQAEGEANAITGPGLDEPSYAFWTMQWAEWIGATPDPYYGGYSYSF
jgi:hypothetical protein